MPFCCEFLPPASFLYLIVASNPHTINVQLKKCPFQHISRNINVWVWKPASAEKVEANLLFYFILFYSLLAEANHLQPFEEKVMNITAANRSQVSTLVSKATESNFWKYPTPARLFTNRPCFTCVAQLVALVLMANPARSTSFYACFSAGAWKRKVIRILSIMFSQMVRIQSSLTI